MKTLAPYGNCGVGRAPVAFGDGSASRLPAELLSLPHWYALRTRSRAEKQTHGLLQAAGVESFPAVAEVERAWKDRTRRVGMPLFPGYIFVRIPLRETSLVLRWPGAVDLVRSRGAPRHLRDEEMDSVFRMTQGITESGTQPSHVEYLVEGETVEVTEGPFRGMRGVLVEASGGHLVAVKLDAIRMARAVRVDRGWVRRVVVRGVA